MAPHEGAVTCYIRRDGRDLVTLDGSTELYRGRSVVDALAACTSPPVVDLTPVRECSYCRHPLPAGYDPATVDEACRMFVVACRLTRAGDRRPAKKLWTDELHEAARRIAHMPPDRCGVK